MAAAPRPKGKLSKIAFAIIGKPANMQKQNGSAFSKKTNRELLAYDTRKMR